MQRVKPRPRLCALYIFGFAVVAPLAQTARMKLIFLAGSVLVAILFIFAFRYHRRSQIRQQAIAQLLDAADALEARLRTARSEIESVAGDHHNPVRAAMQNLLQQRLWLQEHSRSAGIAQLNDVRDSLLQASANLDQQLQRVDRARAGA